ncbi:hypothetical protein CQ14_03280 [Bradyrhizobium lablabi]|uniref:Uncharacterized protein n=1 Tax=Bradyrhizobium lablabi TaxID=722472 RepID=A0A0R3N2A8_9BRAD|nr:hypothetical protein CQ14_03280 [Bradyrhizobium lablabi]
MNSLRCRSGRCNCRRSDEHGWLQAVAYGLAGDFMFAEVKRQDQLLATPVRSRQHLGPLCAGCVLAPVHANMPIVMLLSINHSICWLKLIRISRA